MIQPWQLLRSRPLADYRIAQVRGDLKVSPRNGHEHEFYVLDCPTWINVVATTPDDQIVLVEQFRHGTNTVELEIPGGVMDPQDASPLAAGLRELREETGYEGESAEMIGTIYPNPAIQSNTAYTLLVRNCQLRHEVKLDQTEDLITRLEPVARIPELVATGQIRHSLVVVAFYHYELWRRGRK